MTKGAFPRDTVGLDSWANVRLIHEKPKPNTEVLDDLKLAHGSTKCHRAIGPKGVPTVYVPWGKGDNIDLFPEGFLWERWCTITRGKDHTLTTPKGRTFNCGMWGSMPFLSKADLQRVIEDLPDGDEMGRTGECIEDPIVARVCRQECTSSSIREQLKHLEPDVGGFLFLLRVPLLCGLGIHPNLLCSSDPSVLQDRYTLK